MLAPASRRLRCPRRAGGLAARPRHGVGRLVSALGGLRLTPRRGRRDDADADGVLLDAGFAARRRATRRPPIDARGEEERAALADAGRFCGGKDLPDCPLQAWMKQNATTLLGFGEISSLAEVFDQMAPLRAAQTRSRRRIRRIPHWASIARDGAAAARMGNLTAAKAACRGCHLQYQRSYHAELRALPLPPAPAPTDEP